VKRITKKVENNQDIEWKLYCEMFSNRHMSKYMADTENPKVSAIHAYKSNLKATAQFWPLLALLEVALRTTLNSQLERRNLEKGLNTHWTLDHKNEIRKKNERASRDLQQAHENLRRKRKSTSHGSIIDELPLGFWTILISKRYKELWPDLAVGFKGLESRDSKELDQLLQFFKSFRNRIGHHHVIVFMDLEDSMSKLMRLAYLIDPRLEQILKDISQ
jgi:hypothetical protein